MSHTQPSCSADQALQQLKDGNARFVQGQMTRPNQSPQRRAELTAGQHPFAVVLGCSDSRIAPEILFDQGLGDLFVVRVAGNTAPDVVRWSVEYAVDHLGSALVVVLAHSACGAVTAAVQAQGRPEAGQGLAGLLQPAVHAGDTVDEVAQRSAHLTVQRLVDESPCLRRPGVRVVPAFYDQASGEVIWL